MSTLRKPRPSGPGPLEVQKSATPSDRQFSIVSNTSGRDGEWDDIYVSLSGFCGSYGPHVFAAAPELLASLKEIKEMLWTRPDIVAKLHPLMGFAEKAAFERASAAIAKAEGRS